MYYPKQPRHYTHVPVQRVSGKKEIIQLLEEGWWLDYFWGDAYKSSSGLYIHCTTDTKKVIGDAKHAVCEMLGNGDLVDSQDSEGTPTLSLRDDDILFA
jgi:hypothetical protein